jgi:hypothetical protein
VGYLKSGSQGGYLVGGIGVEGRGRRKVDGLHCSCMQGFGEGHGLGEGGCPFRKKTRQGRRNQGHEEARISWGVEESKAP